MTDCSIARLRTAFCARTQLAETGRDLRQIVRVVIGRVAAGQRQQLDAILW